MTTGTRVTLVVPVRDEADSVAALIRSIQHQVRQPDEIVLVDGGSVDATTKVIRSLTGDDDRYRLLEAGPASPGRGRNIGIESAIHPWVAMTDAGIELDPHWLARLIRCIEHDGEVDVVYGTFGTARRSFFERCADLAYLPPRTPSSVGAVRTRSVVSCLLRKEVWRQAGGFPDLRAGEDLAFMRRLETLGCRFATAPEARVIWHLQGTPRLTFQRFRRYSMHNVLAGQQGDWHYGLARQYIVGIGLVVAVRATRHSPLPLIAAAVTFRVARTIWRRREGRGLLWTIRPDRFALVGAILAIVDAGTFAGWLDAYARRAPHSSAA